MNQRFHARVWLAALLAAAALFSVWGCGGGGAASPPPPPPPLTITTSTLPDALVGQSYSVTLQASGGTPPYAWGLASGSAPLPQGLTLNSGGLISGSPTQLGTFNITLLVQDSALRTATKALSIRSIEAFRITTEALPTGVRGQPYSFRLQAVGGTSPYVWSLSPNSQALPAGITLSTDGTLSGTPTEYTFYLGANTIFRVQDSTGATVTKTIPLIIYDVLRILTTSLPQGNVGLRYGSYSLTALGGAAGYNWSLVPGSGSLPPGIVLQSNGQLEGTPTTAGTYGFTIQVTDQAQPPQTATQALSILIENKLYIVGAQPPIGVVGRNYSYTFQAVGGITPYTWSGSQSRPLPAGLSLDPATGVVSGTPTTPFSGSVEITVTDSSVPPQSYTQVPFFTIQPPLSIITTRLNDAIKDANYYMEVRLGGGLQPYQGRIVAGSLPPDLTLSAPQPYPWLLINGTVTALGTFNFTIEASDSSLPPYVASADFSITVNTRLVLNSITLPDGLEGNPYSVTFSATGGVAPYNWTAFNVPKGLAMDTATGTLSGTPAEAYNLNLGIQVSDSSFPPQQVTQYLPLRIIGRLAITTTQLPPVVVARPLRVGLGVRGGTLPFAWSVSQGALPGGLTLDPATGTISGTPTVEAAYNFTLRVTDSGSGSLAQSTTQALLMVVRAAATFGRNDSIPTATPLSNGTYYASISPFADPPTGPVNPDMDYYQVTANPDAVVTVEIAADRLSPPSPLDSVIEIVDASGTRYKTCSLFADFGPPFVFDCLNDDYNQALTLDSKLQFGVPGTAGTPVTFYVRVLDWRGDARPDLAYTISISGAN